MKKNYWTMKLMKYDENEQDNDDEDKDNKNTYENEAYESDDEDKKKRDATKQLLKMSMKRQQEKQIKPSLGTPPKNYQKNNILDYITRNKLYVCGILEQFLVQ